MMHDIHIDDIEPLRWQDIIKLAAAPDLVSIAKAVLAADRAPGIFGEAAREAVEDALAGRTQAAVEALVREMPADLEDIVAAETLGGDGQLWWLMDSAGNFACIAGQNATIATAAEWIIALRGAARRAAAKAGGFEGAMMAARIARPQLRVVA